MVKEYEFLSLVMARGKDGWTWRVCFTRLLGGGTTFTSTLHHEQRDYYPKRNAFDIFCLGVTCLSLRDFILSYYSFSHQNPSLTYI